MANLTHKLCLLHLLLMITACGRQVEEIKPVGTVTSSAPPIATPAAEDWPWWRGPASDGVAGGDVPPLKWTETENVIWKVSVPGRGHSSPIVVGNQVLVTTADETAETMKLLCFDRATGNESWVAQIHQGGFMHKHHKNSHASATPACDGTNTYCVFMVHGGIWATAVDRQGQRVWQKKVGDFSSKHGYGSSPVLYKSTVIIQGDNHGGGFLAALDRGTGETIWRVARRNSASFATPVVATISGKTQILLSGQAKIVSYDPANGNVLWEAEGPATTTANTINWNDELVFASGGYPQRHVMAIKADGSGEVVWRHKNKVYVPSMLLLGDKLLAVQDDGVARLFEATTGKVVSSKRLGGNFSASPIAVGDYVYLPSESGATVVMKHTPKLEVVAENQLDTSGFATPVICSGRLYLRTDNHIFCIGRSESES